MITINIEALNIAHISQKTYDGIIASIEFHSIPCTCGRYACLVRHGSYKRTVKTSAGKVRLRICRVKCTACGRTHAILLSSMVPYSQISLKDQVDIINCYESKVGYHKILDSNLSIDENNIFSIVLRYRRYWKQRLLSCNISTFPLTLLVEQCFSAFHQQFMQIKGSHNLIFSVPT